MAERLYAVCSDIDETQIISGQKLPSVEVQQAAQELRTASIPLLEVSARSYSMLHHFLDPANGVDLLALQDNYCVLDGGASITRASTGRAEWTRHLPQATAWEIIKGIGGLCSNIHYDKTSKGLRPVELLAAIEQQQMLTGDVPSVFAIFPRTHAEAIGAVLDTVDSIERPRLMQYDKDPAQLCLQVGQAGSNKKHGTSQALQMSGLAGRPVLKVGNGANDIELFAAAPGPNVAMGNSDPELLALADWIAPSVEEHGFVAAVQHFGAYFD